MAAATFSLVSSLVSIPVKHALVPAHKNLQGNVNHAVLSCLLQSGSWDEVSGEAFLRKLLSMPIEEAKYNTVSGILQYSCSCLEVPAPRPAACLVVCPAPCTSYPIHLLLHHVAGHLVCHPHTCACATCCRAVTVCLTMSKALASTRGLLLSASWTFAPSLVRSLYKSLKQSPRRTAYS